ncbi:MAG TPA: hypothetical protein VGO61_19720 [Steroidobacteraceae bacterium]|jgi:hypothetical protein|nr:hypothetical protein [Steroidobacteraceae bacterium]
MLKTLRISIAFIVAVASGPALPTEPAARLQGIAPPTRIPDAPPPAEQAGNPIATVAVPRTVRHAVVADAARRFRVGESAVVLVRAEQITWNDGSLGCPQPGQMYAQSLVPGFRVVAKTSEGEFLYHTDSRGQVLVCMRSSR